MSSQNIDLIPPEKPEPDDCCGSGCKVCVWDRYYEQLEAYEKALSMRGQTGKGSSPATVGGSVVKLPSDEQPKKE